MGLETSPGKKPPKIPRPRFLIFFARVGTIPSVVVVCQGVELRQETEVVRLFRSGACICVTFHVGLCILPVLHITGPYISDTATRSDLMLKVSVGCAFQLCKKLVMLTFPYYYTYDITKLRFHCSLSPQSVTPSNSKLLRLSGNLGQY